MAHKPAPAAPYAHVLEAVDIMDILENKRHELGLVVALVDAPDYKVVLRGGENLYLRTGRYYDVVRAEAATPDAEKKSRDCRLQLSFSMTLDTYGDDVSKALCECLGGKDAVSFGKLAR